MDVIMKNLSLLIFLFAAYTMTASNDSSQIKFYPISHLDNMLDDKQSIEYTAQAESAPVSLKIFNAIYNSLYTDNLTPLEMQEKMMAVTGDKMMATRAYSKTYKKNYKPQCKNKSTPTDADYNELFDLLANDNSSETNNNSSDNQDLEKLFKLFVDENLYADENLYDDQDNQTISNSISTISIPTRPNSTASSRPRSTRPRSTANSSTISIRPNSTMSTVNENEEESPRELKRRIINETGDVVEAQRASSELYRRSEHGKAVIHAYRQSPRYRESQKRRLEKKRLNNTNKRQSATSTSSNNLIESGEFDCFNFSQEDLNEEMYNDNQYNNYFHDHDNE